MQEAFTYDAVRLDVLSRPLAKAGTRPVLSTPEALPAIGSLHIKGKAASRAGSPHTSAYQFVHIQSTEYTTIYLLS